MTDQEAIEIRAEITAHRFLVGLIFHHLAKANPDNADIRIAELLDHIKLGVEEESFEFNKAFRVELMRFSLVAKAMVMKQTT